jgi:hypothetical protein
MLGLVAGAGMARSQAADTFASLMASAMARMDRDMMQPASGDPDRDFAAIIVEQRQEIAVMRQALAALPPATPGMPNLPMHKDH